MQPVSGTATLRRNRRSVPGTLDGPVPRLRHRREPAGAADQALGSVGRSGPRSSATYPVGAGALCAPGQRVIVADSCRARRSIAVFGRRSLRRQRPRQRPPQRSEGRSIRSSASSLCAKASIDRHWNIALCKATGCVAREGSGTRPDPVTLRTLSFLPYPPVSPRPLREARERHRALISVFPPGKIDRIATGCVLPDQLVGKTSVTDSLPPRRPRLSPGPSRICCLRPPIPARRDPALPALAYVPPLCVRARDNLV